MIRHVRGVRPLGVFLVAVTVAGATCEGPSQPGGQGENTIAPRTCHDSGTAGAWNANGLTIAVTQPPCPLTLQDRFSRVEYMAIVKAPRRSITFGTFGGVNSSVTAEAMDRYTRSSIAIVTFVQFLVDANDTMVYRASPTGFGYPGNYPNPANPAKLLDSLHVGANFMVNAGTSVAWHFIDGTISSSPQSVIGPTFVVTGTSGTWRSVPAWDITGYTYRWFLDGQPIAGAQDAQYQSVFGTPGTYSLANETIRSDLSSDTVTQTVHVGPAMQVSINGPTIIRPGATCAWQAVVSNGTSPLAYEWQSQGQGVVGHEQWYSGAKQVGLGSSFKLEVTVADSWGAPGGYAQIIVRESSSAPICPF